ncbi:autophagy-related protein 18g-like isoform X2 [Mangifera indica]|nr:autophagy-related protein 18g-like isoform X2 [Mangifera indica]
MRKGKGRNNGLLPNSLKIISSCLKTVSTNASTVASTVRSAGASVAASISTYSEDHKDQVSWAGFDRLELCPSVCKQVLLLGYQNGFQVLDVEDASNFSELISRRDGPVSFLQMQPLPAKSNGQEGFRKLHPFLLVVAGEDNNGLSLGQNRSHCGGAQDGNVERQLGNCINAPTAVRFYSFQSHCYEHVLRFRSSVCMVRCSPRIVAVGLAKQIYCFDALTLENKFSVLTYPVPQLSGQGAIGVNVGYGPLAVGPRWLAYASNNPLLSNSGRLSPQNLTPPVVSPSTSPGGSSLMARYAMESGIQFAAGLINLGDMGYKTLSKYCQELLPDGSNSPVSPNSVWKVGRHTGADVDNAGMVVVKDFVSRAVISQFKAHTSAISALCFDPSGTLLVTASVYGNNINIFRIMPSCTRSGSGTRSYDWSSSHVHLYKLHRGITSAMIQDICFSHYSQWVAIVSSKGTCHVFVLSPFGGDSGFQTLNSEGGKPSLFPTLSLPWWSSSSCITDQQCLPPPPPVSLSVVSRIKYSSFGWLNTVSNAAASSAGKVFVPSGAVAAVFHNSISYSLQHVNSRANSLEHLLVFTPSGHVVQHELLPAIDMEPSESDLRTRTASSLHVQEDDLRVRVEPVQWWDVCRRSDWLERGESISEASCDRQDFAEIVQSKSNCDGNHGMELLDINHSVGGKSTEKSYSVKSNERSHWYLSNAEVQISSLRPPIWQNSKIFFSMMDSPRVNPASGEFEIEKALVHEVEIKRKELLPVFEHFHSIKSSWDGRILAGEKCPHSLSLEPQQSVEKIPQETVICHSKPASLSSTESSEGSSSRRIEHLLDLDQVNHEKSYMPSGQVMYQGRQGSTLVEPSSLNKKSLDIISSPSDYSKKANSYGNNHIPNGPPLLASNLPLPGRNPGGLGDTSMLTADYFDSHMKIVEGPARPSIQAPVNFGLSLQEGHCEALKRDECYKSTEVVNDDVDSSSCHCEREKLEEDRENDEMFGGMFAFSEEG